VYYVQTDSTYLMHAGEHCHSLNVRNDMQTLCLHEVLCRNVTPTNYCHIFITKNVLWIIWLCILILSNITLIYLEIFRFIYCKVDQLEYCVNAYVVQLITGNNTREWRGKCV